MEETPLSDESVLASLVSLWQRRRAEGEQVSSAELCRENPSLRAELERRVAALERMNGLAEAVASEQVTLAHSAAPPAPEQATFDPGATQPPTQPPTAAPLAARTDWPSVPGYEILGVLGQGGMGVVYKARQLGLRRVVALKMILHAEHAGPEERRRFRIEGEAVARLQHANIVQVHEVGEHNGLPYFSLEYCPGGSLADKLDGTPLPPVEAARLVQTLALAMRTAHKAGIVHRDLKPANVLLAEEGSPKVTDFGLAKQMDAAGQTHSGAILGTPSYMAPEQADGRKDVGPAADGYALGAILYELLTGRPPFKAATALDTVLQVVRDEPVPVRRLQPKVPRDLETICLRCLEKDPRKRYAGASELAEDLRRFGAGEPVAARPVGVLGKAAKWARRRPGVAALLALVAVVASAGLAGIAWAYGEAVAERERARAEARRADDEARRADGEAATARGEAERADREAAAARREARRAEEKADEAQRQTYIAQVGRADAQLLAGDHAAAENVLDKVAPEFRGWEYHYLCRRTQGTPLTLRGHTDGVNCACFSADGSRIATSSADKLAKVWDAHRGVELFTLRGHDDRVTSICFNADGSRLATGSDDKTVKVWDARSGFEVLTLRGHEERVNSVCFSPDGSRIVTASWDKMARVWDARGGALLRTLRGHTHIVDTASFSPDGSRIVTASLDNSAKVWDADSGAELLTLVGHTEPVNSARFSPDGSRIATASVDKTAKLWDARRGVELRTFRGHAEMVNFVSFSPDGSRLVTASEDRTTRVWNIRDGSELFILRGHTEMVNAASFSPDGSRIVTASDDDTAKVWDAYDGAEPRTLRHLDSGGSVCFSPEGARLATTAEDATAKIWDARRGVELVTLRGHTKGVMACCFSPDGSRLATASADATARLWDSRGGPALLTLRGHVEQVNSVCFHPDGSCLATASRDRTAKVWDAVRGANLLTLRGHTKDVESVSFSPDGTRLLTASDDTTAKVWDARRGVLLLTVRGHSGGVNSACFSPDGSRIVTASWDNTAKIWDAGNGTLLHTLQGHTAWLRYASYSPDGLRIVTVSDDKTARLWDARRATELLVLRGHAGGLDFACFSFDGSRLATASRDDTAKVWDARRGVEALVLRGHTGQVNSVYFSSDGSCLVSTDDSGQTLVWDAVTGQLLRGKAPPGRILSSNVSPDGRSVAVPDEDVIRLYLRPPSGYDPWVEDELRRRALGPSRHTEDAAAAEKAGDWYAAAFHLSWLLGHVKPGDAELRKRRAAVVAAAIKSDPKNAAALLAHARLCLEDGDLAAYRQTCATLAQTADLRAAWTCALAPDALANWKPLLRDAEKQAAASKDRQSLRTLGGLLLRAGRPGDAVKQLQAALASRDSEGPPIEEILLALAHHKHGQDDEARRWLARTDAWMDQGRGSMRASAAVAAGAAGPLAVLSALHGEAADPRLTPMAWTDRLDVLLLHREARTLLQPVRR